MYPEGKYTEGYTKDIGYTEDTEGIHKGYTEDTEGIHKGHTKGFCVLTTKLHSQPNV